jgi:hypothetical protein
MIQYEVFCDSPNQHYIRFKAIFPVRKSETILKISAWRPGRFVFPVGKEQANKDEIYTNLVFYLLGEDFNFSEHINGFRFISPKNSQSFYRVEIWVDFDKENTEVLTHFQTLLTSLFQSLSFDSRSVRFLNNKQEAKEEGK